MKKAVKIIFYLLSVISFVIFLLIYFLNNMISKNYKVQNGKKLQIDTVIPITTVYKDAKMSQSNYNYSAGDTFTVDLKLFGVIPFSTVNVEVVDDMYVNVLGNPFGMKIYTDGVLVIESTDIVTKNGKSNPAIDSGIKIGDYIKSVDGQKITCNEELSQLVSESNGNVMEFQIVRDKKILNYEVTPIFDDNSNVYRIGIWVRDSSAGIGTLTFYSPSTNVICGLGHGICDSDTETLLNIEKGELVGANIVSVEKGSSGMPGALKGKFTYETIADIKLNCYEGVYGIMKEDINAVNFTEVALKQDIYDGEAQVLCTINGNTPKLYSCTVKKNTTNSSNTQNLIVTITDSELIEITGGIVQGMSGSPILQNGKLIGALTHVLVSDSHTGYGIYAENMLETAKNVAKIQDIKAAS